MKKGWIANMLLNKKILLFFSLIGLCLLSACAEKEKLADGSELINKNQFVFAASGEFKPFSYINNDLTMSGFDIEVGEALAKEMGLKPVQKRIKFKGIVEGVKTGRADAAVASHTINPQRSKHVAFSTPYYYSETNFHQTR